MPFTPAQHRLFQAAAHNPAIAKAHAIPRPKAAQMAAEGVRARPAAKVGPDALAAALRASAPMKGQP